MIEITEMLADFRAYGREEYLTHHPYPVLLHQTNRGDSEAESGFVTGVKQARRRVTAMSIDPLAERQTARSATGLLVFPVRPMVDVESTLGMPRISLGRDLSRDVQLPYDKVSSLHAFLTLAPDGRWLLEDNGATNGTFVDGERITAHEPVAVGSGDVIKLGPAEVTFYLAADFHDYLLGLTRALGQR